MANLGILMKLYRFLRPSAGEVAKANSRLLIFINHGLAQDELEP